MFEAICTFYIVIVMSLIALIHLYWLKGGLWPGKDYQDLVNKVLGKGNKLPNSFLFIFVIVVFCLMAILPLLIFMNITIVSFEKEILLFFSAVFFIRSLYMFLPFIAKQINKVFLDLNRNIYAPLCFTLATSYYYLYSLI